MSFKLGSPPDPKDNNFFQWINLLWKYLLRLTLTSDIFAGNGDSGTVLHGNGDGNPYFAPVDLQTDVTGFITEQNLADVGNPGSRLYTFYNCGGL